MRTLAEVVAVLGRVDEVQVTAWIRHGWVTPAQRSPEPAFSDLDVARLCLIRDLRVDLAIEDEALPLVLSLVDQLYATRRRMNALSEAVQQQPEQVREAILACAARREQS